MRARPIPTDGTWFHVSTSRATGAVVVRDARVVFTCPYFSFLLGKTARECVNRLPSATWTKL